MPTIPKTRFKKKNIHHSKFSFSKYMTSIIQFLSFIHPLVVSIAKV